jgi:hypothetical protein
VRAAIPHGTWSVIFPLLPAALLRSSAPHVRGAPAARDPAPRREPDRGLQAGGTPERALAGDRGHSLPEVLAREGIRAIPVHRLDREVSGATLLALDEESRELLETIFRERALSKTYWALAQGRVRPEQGAMKYPILEEGSLARVSARGKESVTKYRDAARAADDDRGRDRSRHGPAQPDPRSLRARGLPARRRAEVRAREGFARALPQPPGRAPRLEARVPASPHGKSDRGGSSPPRGSCRAPRARLAMSGIRARMCASCRPTKRCTRS